MHIKLTPDGENNKIRIPLNALSYVSGDMDDNSAKVFFMGTILYVEESVEDIDRMVGTVIGV